MVSKAAACQATCLQVWLDAEIGLAEVITQPASLFGGQMIALWFVGFQHKLDGIPYIGTLHPGPRE